MGNGVVYLTYEYTMDLYLYLYLAYVLELMTINVETVHTRRLSDSLGSKPMNNPSIPLVHPRPRLFQHRMCFVIQVHEWIVNDLGECNVDGTEAHPVFSSQYVLDAFLPMRSVYSLARWIQ